MSPIHLWAGLLTHNNFFVGILLAWIFFLNLKSSTAHFIKLMLRNNL